MNTLQNGSIRQSWQYYPEMLPLQGWVIMLPPYKRKMAAELIAASFSFRMATSAENGSIRQSWQYYPLTTQLEGACDG